MDNSNANITTVFRYILISLSLITMVIFLLGFGTGSISVFFAVSGAVIQLTALLFLPGVTNQCWQSKNIPLALISGMTLGVVLLISVSGSTAVLSGLVGQQIQQAEERAALLALIESNQASADVFNAYDKPRSAAPHQEKVEVLRGELKAMVQNFSVYVGVQNVFGDYAKAVTTSIILAFSVVLDLLIVLLGFCSPISAIKPPSTPSQKVVTNNSNPPEWISGGDSLDLASDVQRIREGLGDGSIDRPIFREVRPFLQCGAERASAALTEFKRLYPAMS